MDVASAHGEPTGSWEYVAPSDMEARNGNARKRAVEDEEPGYYCLLEYSSQVAMEADLGSIIDVSMIETEVVVGGETYYNDFQLEYSDDGSSWKPENPVGCFAFSRCPCWEGVDSVQPSNHGQSHPGYVLYTCRESFCK